MTVCQRHSPAPSRDRMGSCSARRGGLRRADSRFVSHLSQIVSLLMARQRGLRHSLPLLRGVRSGRWSLGVPLEAAAAPANESPAGDAAAAAVGWRSSGLRHACCRCEGLAAARSHCCHIGHCAMEPARRVRSRLMRPRQARTCARTFGMVASSLTTCLPRAPRLHLAVGTRALWARAARACGAVHS